MEFIKNIDVSESRYFNEAPIHDLNEVNIALNDPHKSSIDPCIVLTLHSTLLLAIVFFSPSYPQLHEVRSSPSIRQERDLSPKVRRCRPVSPCSVPVTTFLESPDFSCLFSRSLTDGSSTLAPLLSRHDERGKKPGDQISSGF